MCCRLGLALFLVLAFWVCWGRIGALLLSTMEGSSGGEKKLLPVEATKIKRKMKTASQLDILEKAYAGVYCVVFLFPVH